MVPTEDAAASARTNLESMIARLRVGAEAQVLVGPREEFPHVLRTASADADLIFIGLADPDQVDDYVAYYERLQTMTAGLPSTVFVLASEDLDFAEVLL